MYCFSALEGKEGNYCTAVVGDIYTLQYWRNSLKRGLQAVNQKPIKDLADKIKTTVKLVFEYFANFRQKVIECGVDGY